MKKRKNFGRKIKRAKNIYRPKKTKTQKIVSTVLLIVGLAALAFVGFCLGKPILDFFGRDNGDSEIKWTPSAAVTEAPEASETEAVAEAPETEPVTEAVTTPVTEAVTTPVTEEAVTEEPVKADGLKAYSLPSGALSNRASLSSALAGARVSGYNSAVILLKDESGYFHYRSEIEGVEEHELIKGGMNLFEITEVFKENGITPIAEISVLKDNAGAAAFPEISYKCYGEDVSWLDYKSGDEPVRWIRPDSVDSVSYIGKIYDEITASGITEIIYSELVFPPIQGYDREYLSPDYFGSKRYTMLQSFLKPGILVEIRAEDIVSEEYGRTAEILGDISAMADVKIALVIDRESFPPEEGYPAAYKNLIEDATAYITSKIGGNIPIVPVINSPYASEAEEILGIKGYKDYIVR